MEGQMTTTPKPRPGWLDKDSALSATRRMAKVNVWLYQHTGGRVGGKWRVGSAFRKPAPVLLLSHVGRKSGTSYTTPLLYLHDGPDVVVVASSGGMPKDPQWLGNLLAAPETELQIRSEVVPVRARLASAQEKARLWPRLVDLYADFASYQSWTDRDIPVVICEPR